MYQEVIHSQSIIKSKRLYETGKEENTNGSKEIQELSPVGGASLPLLLIKQTTTLNADLLRLTLVPFLSPTMESLKYRQLWGQDSLAPYTMSICMAMSSHALRTRGAQKIHVK